MPSNFREKYLRRIGPLYLACVLGLLAVGVGAVSILISPYPDGLGLGLLSVAALILFTVLLIERYLAATIAFKKLFLAESLLLAALPLIWCYSYQSYDIAVKTDRHCFIAVYSDSGLQLQDLPRSGLFDRHLEVYYPIVWVHNDLANKNEFCLIEPREWGGYSSHKTDTIINGRTLQLVQYSMNKSSSCETELLNQIYLQLTQKN